MASRAGKSAALILLIPNLILSIIVTIIVAWAVNHAIERTHVEAASVLITPAGIFSIYFPFGNMATGAFVIFSLIAGVVVSWSLTLLAMARPPAVPIPALESTDRSELYQALESSLSSPFSSEPYVPNPNPLIVVISGPSGVGKDAVIKRLIEVRETIYFVVTATSRPKRAGEIDGKDYFFVSKDEFLSMVERDEFLEYALVYEDYKGVPENQIREKMAKGCDIVMRVDIQGAATLKKILGNSAVFVFLVAENEAALVKRLINRKTETVETLRVRIATAREEVKHVKDFDYVVVNAEGKLEDSVKLVESIIDAEKAKVWQRKAVV